MKTQRIIHFVTALALVVTTIGLYFLAVPSGVVLAAPNEINGTVYLDYNDNGQRNANDTGVGGITVTAYDTNNTVVATTTTLPDGTYTLSVPDGTEVRIEFTNIPPGLFPGAVGNNSDSSVVFITSPLDNVDMGLNKPESYCQFYQLS